MRKLHWSIWILFGAVVSILVEGIAYFFKISLHPLGTLLISVIVIVVTLSLVSFIGKRKKIHQARDLTEALSIGFHGLIHGREIIGPQGKVQLLRVKNPQGLMKDRNAIYVLDESQDCTAILFVVHLTKKGLSIKPWKNEEFKDWEDRW